MKIRYVLLLFTAVLLLFTVGCSADKDEVSDVGNHNYAEEIQDDLEVQWCAKQAGKKNRKIDLAANERNKQAPFRKELRRDWNMESQGSINGQAQREQRFRLLASFG